MNCFGKLNIATATHFCKNNKYQNTIIEITGVWISMVKRNATISEDTERITTCIWREIRYWDSY